MVRLIVDIRLANLKTRYNYFFIDFLGVKSTASQDDINKAFREKSRVLHPDKVKQSIIAAKAKASRESNLQGKKREAGVISKKGALPNELGDALKKASERFSRLGVVASILKGPGRERYDYFLNNGFPKWRGTGYYYARFRPGLLSVLVGLFVIFGGIVHYSAMYLSWNRQRGFVERYVRRARQAAWGDDSVVSGLTDMGDTSGVPTARKEEGTVLYNRRQKRLQDKENKKEKDKKSSRSARNSKDNVPPEAENHSGPTGSRKRVQAENGKILIVDSLGRVFLEAENDHGDIQEYLLDPDEIPRPTVSQTLMVRLPTWLLSKFMTSVREGMRIFQGGATNQIDEDKSQ
jgi:hypothetical protein